MGTWVSSQEAAKVLGYKHSSTIRKLAKKGRIERKPADKGFLYFVDQPPSFQSQTQPQQPDLGYLVEALGSDVGNRYERILQEHLRRYQFRELERKAEFRHKYQREFYLGNKPILLGFFSDHHFGHHRTNVKKAVDDAILFADTEGAYVALLGDSIDNMIIGNLAKAGAREGDPIPEQVKLAGAYLWRLHRNKTILWYLSGNHDLWSMKLSGMDLFAGLCRNLNLAYDPFAFGARILLGPTMRDSREYRIYSRHKYRGFSIYNYGHPSLRLYLEGDYRCFNDRLPDIVVTGHTHKMTSQQFPRNGKMRYIAVCSTYKSQYDWAEEKGFAEAPPVFPAYILRPDRKLVEPVTTENLEEICKETLPWLRKKYS